MSMSIDNQPKDSATPVWAQEESHARGWINELGVRIVAEISAGIRLFSRQRRRDTVGILTYHRTTSPVQGVPTPLYNVPPKRFRKQLSGLLAQGYEFWPLRKVLRYRTTGTDIPPRVLVVTFDDGFETVYRDAWTVLQYLGIPATVFLNTAYIETEAPFPFDAWGGAYRDSVPRETYRPLTWGQCDEMAASGLVDFGAHTHTHQDFRGRPEEFQEDLVRSVSIVREHFMLQDVMFAFPYGNSKQGFAGGDLTAAARRAGVICSLTTDAHAVDHRSDPFQWGRFHAFSWDRSATLAAKVEGFYGWAPRLRRNVSDAIRRRAFWMANRQPQQYPSTDSTTRRCCHE